MLERNRPLHCCYLIVKAFQPTQMFCQPILPPASRKEAKKSGEDSVLFLAYSGTTGGPVGKGVSSCLTIIKQLQTASDWVFAVATLASIIIQIHV